MLGMKSPIIRGQGMMHRMNEVDLGTMTLRQEKAESY